MNKTLIALLMVCAAGTALAQQGAYATIKSVEGLVTVTSGNQLSNATKDLVLPRGAQILSTTSGKATVVFGSGCTVTVQPGQTLLIEEAACTAFLAQSGGAGAGAGAGTSAALMTPTNLALGALGLGVLYSQTRDRGQAAATPISGS